MCGTICTNRKLMFHKTIMFTKSEAHQHERGTSRVAINQDFGLVPFGWLDGNPVHMLSSADGAEMATVKHTLRGEKLKSVLPWH